MKKFFNAWLMGLIVISVIFPLILPFTVLVIVIRLLDVSMHNRRYKRVYGSK